MKNVISTIPVTILIIAVMLIAPVVAADEVKASAEGTTVDQPKVRDWILRFGVVVAETSGSTSVAVDPGTVDIKLSGGGGGFANIEYKLFPFLGLEFGSTTIAADMNVSAGVGLKHVHTDVDALGMSSLSIAANFHFVRTPTVSVYAGPMLAFNRYSKWTVHSGWDDDCWPAKHGCDEWVSVRSKSDSEVTWGAKLGIDIVLTKRGNWALSGSISYLDATYNFDEGEGQGSGSIDFNPLMFSFGGGFRF